MIGQMSNIKESWVDTTKDDDWLLVDNEEKQLITRILRDSTSWGREALKKFDEFKEKEFIWRRNEKEAALRYQEWVDSINTPPDTVASTALTQQQKKSQLLKLQQAALPDSSQPGHKQVAVRM